MEVVKLEDFPKKHEATTLRNDEQYGDSEIRKLQEATTQRIGQRSVWVGSPLCSYCPIQCFSTTRQVHKNPKLQNITIAQTHTHTHTHCILSHQTPQLPNTKTEHT